MGGARGTGAGAWGGRGWRGGAGLRVCAGLALGQATAVPVHVGCGGIGVVSVITWGRDGLPEAAALA